jgi:hypothetical protein
MLVVVGNTYEFNHGQSEGAGEPSPELRRRLFTASSLCAAMVRYPDGNLILPHKPHEAWMQYMRSVYGVAPAMICTPQETPLLSAHLLTDESFAASAALSRANAVPWGYTPNFPRACAIRGWAEPWRRTVDWESMVSQIQRLDSKIGSHEFLANALKETRSAVRRPSATAIDAANPKAFSHLENMFYRWKRVIVKPNRSWGGRGCFSIISDQELPRARKAIEELAKEPWHDGRFVIEQFVGSDADQPSPTADYMVGFDGGEGTLVIGQMYIRNYRCLGTRYDRHVLSPEVEKTIRPFATICQKRLRDIGYSGWFDIDFVLAENCIWATEINVRMTGGTVPLMLMEGLYGEDWKTGKSLSTRDGLVCRSKTKIESLIDVVEARGRLQFGPSLRCHVLNLDYTDESCIFSAMMVADSDVSLAGAVELLESVTQEFAC